MRYTPNRLVSGSRFTFLVVSDFKGINAVWHFGEGQEQLGALTVNPTQFTALPQDEGRVPNPNENKSPRTVRLGIGMEVLLAGR